MTERTTAGIREGGRKEDHDPGRPVFDEFPISVDSQGRPGLTLLMRGYSAAEVERALHPQRDANQLVD